MEKRKNYYIIIGCIVLLILLVGIGIYFVFDKQEQNETTEKIVYKILKDKENNYSLQKENKENLEEVGEYTCESKECEATINYNTKEPRFIIYDNGYNYIALENNQINVQKFLDINQEEINTIHNIIIR